ncbi:Unknown protein [Striga hermonthica]|uniref:Uncharacterized protein n=1 Tax=Striga hermonthica TaxID=68872 RepID=A0A9N7NKI5_STRHE|nr:Unknown protein [Striga hermonthica]
MITRSSGNSPAKFDSEIEASCRRNNANRRLQQRLRGAMEEQGEERKIPKRQAAFLELRRDEPGPSASQGEKKDGVPKLELKPLPEHLKYAYLGENDTFPVIVSSYLSNSELERLLRVLRGHKSAFGRLVI